MRATAAVVMLLVLGTAPAEGPSPSQDARHAPALARLTLAEARALEGRRGLWTVEPESQPGEHEGRVGYDCVGPQEDLRTVWLFPGQSVRPVTVVEGVLRLVWHGPSKDGVFPGFWEMRVTDAVVVK